ncbi:hypothetical protein CW713_05260 [Methanophagales archaeon]|nr:MAG: hypothetical protein CW713_05260 [Methanophagales archaeon]
MEREREEILSAIYHCKLCSIASFHPQEEWLPLCPSGQFYGYQAFYAPGKMEIFRAILEGEITEPSDGLLNAIYACKVCGTCYEKSSG